MTDTHVHRLGYAAMLLVAAVAAEQSFIHIVALALAYGETNATAYPLPVSIDGCVAACSLALLRAARLDIPTPGLAQVGLFSAVAATLAANVGYGLSANLGRGWLHATVGSLLAGWPAYAFIICAELAIGMVRRAGRKARKPVATPQPVATRPAPVATSQPDVATVVAADRVAAVVAAMATRPDLTGQHVATMGLADSPRSGRRLLAAARASQNG